MKFVKILLPVFIVIALSYFAIQPFLLSGFFPVHDDTQVARVYEMAKSLKEGMFPVRWVVDLGYNFGYPIFNFYAPLAYYVGSFFMFLGFDALIATKIMMVLGIILSGIFMYLLAKEFWGMWGGLVSAVLYLYVPYHALNIYVRGDVAEFWACAFIPLVFYGLWKSYLDRKWRYVIVGSIGFAAVILSHNLSALMIAPFILVTTMLFLFLAIKQKGKSAFFPLLVVVIGILLASTYWIPVFAEMKFTNVLSQVGGGADYADHFVCLPQLWDSPWGFGGSTPTCIDGLSYKIGKLHVLLFVVSLGSIFLLRKEPHKFWTGIFSVVSILIVVFLMLRESKFIWDAIGPMAFLQYPWRFLLILSFFASFLGGASILFIDKIRFRVLAGLTATGLIFVIIFFNSEVFVPQMHVSRTANDYTNKSTLIWNTSKISDEYMPKGFFEPKEASEVPARKFPTEGLEMVSAVEKTHHIYADVTASEETEISVNLAYFPAWQVFIDGKTVPFTPTKKGLDFSIPKGSHVVEIKFIETPIERTANILSICGVLVLFLGIINVIKSSGRKSKSTL